MTVESPNDSVAGLQISKEQKRQLAALRHPFEGVFNVFAFNWPKYILSGILTYALVFVFIMQADPVMKKVCIVSAAILVIWTLVSLLVSLIVYDLSGLYKYHWLLRSLNARPATILNLNAGFDELSEALQILFPDAALEIYDFYSGITNTEPSIEMARSISQSPGENSKSLESEPVLVSLSGWDLPDQSQDLIVLFMAAHEVRKPEDREKFFNEIHRVLKKSGQCVLVEHLRDTANFLAFGPGFFHFYPRSEWMRLAKQCKFDVKGQKPVTPFVRVFSLCKT